MKNGSRSNALLVELLLVIFFFMISAAILVQVFADAKMKSANAKAMNASYAVNGIVKYNTLMDDGKTEAALKELERKLQNSESGFLPLDLKAEFTPLEHKSELVDKDTFENITGRNDPCPCGSGKKYKHCHGKKS